MVRVSIDIEAATGVVSSLRGFFDEAMDEWSTVSNAAGRALCSTASLKALSDPLVLVSHSAKDLETRVELAVLVNTGDDGVMPVSGVVSYELSGSDMIGNVKDRLGRELADGLRNLDAYDYLSRQDVVEFEHYTALMEKYAEDPAVTDGLFDALGPQGVVELPVLLKDFAKNYQQYLSGHPEGDLFWDEDTPMSVRIADLQQRFIEAYGMGLGTATSSDSFNGDNPGFAKKIVEAVTEQRAGLGWGLSQVLRYGDYDAGFLISLGTGLYDWEIGQYGPVWGPQVQYDEWSWRLGTDDDGRYFDPFVGLFEAMGRNPEGAANFFNPDPSEPDGKEAEGEESAAPASGVRDEAWYALVEARAGYFLRDRSWYADDFDALAQALDAASTTWHHTNATPAQQEQAAWIASATVHYLGQRGEPERWGLGASAKVSLGHLLTAYIADVDLVANRYELEAVPPGAGTPPTDAVWDTGGPVRASFAGGGLNAVMREVLTEDVVLGQLVEAAAGFNARRMSATADGWATHDEFGPVRVAAEWSAGLNGFVVGNLERGTVRAGRAVVQRNKMFVEMGVDVLGLVPVGGTLASMAAQPVIHGAAHWWEGRMVDYEQLVAEETYDVEVESTKQLTQLTAMALLATGRIDDAREVEQPWFDRGQFDPDVLDDPAIAADFRNWVNVGNAGDVVASLGPHLHTGFSNGKDRATEED